MMIDQQKRTQLRKLCDAATPNFVTDSDIEFYTTARTAVPELLDEVESWIEACVYIFELMGCGGEGFEDCRTPDGLRSLVTGREQASDDWAGKAGHWAGRHDAMQKRAEQAESRVRELEKAARDVLFNPVTDTSSIPCSFIAVRALDALIGDSPEDQTP